MVRSETINNMVVRHYSDQNKMIRQVETDTLWTDAVDVVPCQFTYEETSIDIPDEELDDIDALLILLGGAK